jgi:transcriptional regulator with GAF, ATPase, and Fis domain
MRLLLERGHATERAWVVGDVEITIGRDRTCDIRLQDPSIPALQARVYRAGADVIIENMSGEESMRLEGESLPPWEPVRLVGGARLEIGDTLLTASADEEPSAPEPDHPPTDPAEDTRSNIHPDRLAVIGEVCEVILRLGNRKAFFEKILDAIFNTLDVRRAVIMLLTGETGAPETIGTRNLEGDPAGAGVEVSGTILGRTLRKGQAQILQNAMTMPDLADAESVADFGIKSVLCVPIRTRDRVEGLIYADNRFREASFVQDDLEYLSVIGRLVGIILEDLDRRELQERRIQDLRARLREGVEFIHTSPEMTGVLELVKRLAPSEGTVLITGESGAGKELVARTLHNLSTRSEHVFTPINCAALPDSLLESELFGHERGAFTGAIRKTMGRFEAAAGGTLFLDEIGEMRDQMQAKLLRVLDGNPFERVGGTEPIEVNVRIIAATNRNLKSAVERGEFREDLYYRIEALSIFVPPLRDRPDDILTLANHFLGDHGKRRLRLAPDVAKTLLRYPWPGNVRELKNTIEAAVINCPHRVIRIEHLPEKVAHAPEQPIAVRPLRDVVRDHILRTFEKTGQNVQATATALGIARNTVYKALKEDQQMNG